MYLAKDIAKYTVTKCVRDGQPISNLQLQKILYNIQREFLKHRPSAAFGDEIEAWRFGPVVPNIYYDYCGYGSMPITMEYDTEVAPEDQELINGVIEKKRAMHPWELVEESHREGGPWAITIQKSGPRGLIPMELIREKG